MDEVKIIEDMLNKKLKDDRVYVMVEVSYDMYANELFLTAGNKKSLVAYITNNRHMCNEEYNDGIHGSHHIAIVDTCLDYNGEVF